MHHVYRIQDSDGRGPWKPGFSHRWVEVRPDHDLLSPWYEEFGRVDQQATPGMHIGCGCRDVATLMRWFTPTEYRRLLGFGYRAVSMTVDRILAESVIQCVFERRLPLRQEATAIDLYGLIVPRPATVISIARA